MAMQDRSIQSSLTATAPGYPIVLPLTEDGQLHRIMLQFDKMRYAFLMKHPEYSHWNGYFLFPRTRWEDPTLTLKQDVATVAAEHGLEISYAGLRNRHISWLTTAGKSRKMSRAINLGVIDDFWVGFSTHEVDRNWEPMELIPVLKAIAETAWNHG